MFSHTDSLFVGIGLFPRRYAVTKNGGDTLYTFGNYPFEENIKKARYGDLAMTYQGELILHPKKAQFAVATRAIPNLEIFDISNGNISLIKKYSFWPPVLVEDKNSPNTFSATFSSKNKFGFFSSRANENFIYLLYSGKSGKERMKANTVFVFDWKGQPIVKYILDRDEIFSIAIDKDSNELFALTFEKEEAIIVRYKLPKN